MKGSTAIDPESGAPLSREREFPFDGSFHRSRGFYFHDPSSAVSTRTPDPDEHTNWDSSREGALTTGETHSSADALRAFFKREAEANDAYALDFLSAGLTAIEQLRLQTDEIDEFVWYVTAERLTRKGHDARWMRGSVVPKCPFCNSDCKPGNGEVRCASSPTIHGHVRDDIKSHVVDIYEAVFGEQIDEMTAFNPPADTHEQVEADA